MYSEVQPLQRSASVFPINGDKFMLTTACVMWAAAAALLIPHYSAGASSVSLYTAGVTAVRPTLATGVAPTGLRRRTSALGASNYEEPDMAATAAMGAIGAANVAQNTDSIPLPLAFTGMGLSLLAIVMAFFKPPTSGAQPALAGVAPKTQSLEQTDLAKIFSQPMQMAGMPVKGDKLNRQQMQNASHVCADCGFIYALPTAFADQPANYKCPLCDAGKNRFATYDPVTGATGSVGIPLYLILSVASSAAFIGLILWAALSRGGH